MHPSAINNCKQFFETYSDSFSRDKSTIVVEIGSQDINGSLRSICPHEFEYIGVDFQSGKGVDITIDDPYSLPFNDESVDIVLSSSCFEHSEMFWLVFLEVMRILKPSGIFYLNSPSNGSFHRFPVDCWRFYPDSGTALISWAKKCNINAALLESYISNQLLDQWNDFVGVFIKDEREILKFRNRIIDNFSDFKNGKKYGFDNFIKYSEIPDDILKLMTINHIINNKIKLT